VQADLSGVAPQHTLFEEQRERTTAMTPERWEPKRSPESNPWPAPDLMTAVFRGLRGLCPVCGKGRVFKGFLKVVPECSICGAPLGLARADDAPPYFTILIVGHIMIPLLFIVDRSYEPPVWITTAIFVPLTLVLTMGLIRPIKGATVGLMFSLNMLKSDPTAT
jgi:uncharacterized protein (DUF983 family)